MSRVGSGEITMIRIWTEIRNEHVCVTHFERIEQFHLSGYESAVIPFEEGDEEAYRDEIHYDISRRHSVRA